MSEQEKRWAYNKRAAELNATYQMRKYPGMIQGMEMPATLNQGGFGIISVTDAVNYGLNPEDRYNPSPGQLLMDGRAVKTPGEQRGLNSIMPPGMAKTEKMEKPAKQSVERQYNLRSLLK